MEKELKQLLEILPEGLRVDIPEGFRKLIKSQFGGNPGKAFGELIQNFLDSYPPEMPMEERKGLITSDQDSISMTDYGSGLSLEKIRLLLTLGGSDKNPEQHIGRFGIGFYSMLNPRLHTKRVEVVTRCKGETVGITMELPGPDELPKITLGVLEEQIEFSTRVRVIFSCEDSVRACLAYAKKVLQYYPCKVVVNGEPLVTIWENPDGRSKYFTRTNISGLVLPGRRYSQVTLLCRYEYITTMDMHCFPKGGYDLTYDLKDYSARELPFVPHFDAVINNNHFKLTISRDGFYLDNAFHTSVEFLREMLAEQLLDLLKNDRADDQVILANLYILRKRIMEFTDKKGGRGDLSRTEKDLFGLLLNAKVFPVADSKTAYSVNEIKNGLSKGYPLFYSEERLNTNWLGGAFRHDFILLPAPCEAYNGASNFYQDLLGTLFTDLVNLDKIQRDFKKITTLVSRGIVDKSALSPHCEFVGSIMLTPPQKNLLEELNAILETEEIKGVIAANLRVTVNSITTVFFTVGTEGAYISTGLFHGDGVPFSEEPMTNFSLKRGGTAAVDCFPRDLFLGLRIDHPVIHVLMGSKDRFKAYYTLTYVAHELALCQKMLVPFSPLFHVAKERLAAEMRMAMMTRILNHA